MPDRKQNASKMTDAVHAGEPRKYAYDAVALPIVQTATYVFENTAEVEKFMETHSGRDEYGRYGNPTVRQVEEKMAQLEHAEDALFFSSGMAALTSAIVALTRAGSHVILFEDCYRRTRQFIAQILSRFGVTHTLVPAADLEALQAAFTKDTKLVISEAPSNPYLTVLDIPKLVAICKEHRAKTMIDATFATPINICPLDLGIDLVAHSATKYLAGHNDVLAGVVSGKSGLISLIREVRDVMGPICDPHAAYLVHRGIKTLSLRVEQQNQSAMALATWLHAHPKIKRVFYPGLPSHPQHAIAKTLMSGFGGVVTFEMHGDTASTSRFIDALKIPRIGPSLGGVESLVEQPAIQSYSDLSEEQRLAIGMPGTLVRFALGIENKEDIINDVKHALDSM